MTVSSAGLEVSMSHQPAGAGVKARLVMTLRRAEHRDETLLITGKFDMSGLSDRDRPSAFMADELN